MKSTTGNKLLRRGFWVLLAVGLVVLIGSILWVGLLPGLVVSKIEARTGFAVQMSGLSLNPFTGSLIIKGLVLTNPEEWDGGTFVEVRELRVKSSLFAVFSDRYQADEIMVDVAQVNLVRDKHGVLNALAFKDRLAGRPADISDTAGKPSATKGFLIKKLYMKFDVLTYNDHSDFLPGTRKYNLKVDCELNDVDTVAKLVSPFSGSALNLITDTIGNLFTGSTDLLKGTAGLIEDVGKKTGKTLKGLLDSLDKKKP